MMPFDSENKTADQVILDINRAIRKIWLSSLVFQISPVIKPMFSLEQLGLYEKKGISILEYIKRNIE